MRILYISLIIFPNIFATPFFARESAISVLNKLDPGNWFLFGGTERKMDKRCGNKVNCNFEEWAETAENYPDGAFSSTEIRKDLSRNWFKSTYEKCTMDIHDRSKQSRLERKTCLDIATALRKTWKFGDVWPTTTAEITTTSELVDEIIDQSGFEEGNREDGSGLTVDFDDDDNDGEDLILESGSTDDKTTNLPEFDIMKLLPCNETCKYFNGYCSDLETFCQDSFNSETCNTTKSKLSLSLRNLGDTDFFGNRCGCSLTCLE